jgi:hypothetical protein
VQGALIYNMSGHTCGGGCSGSGGALGVAENANYIQFSLVHDFGGETTTCGGPVGLWAYNSTGSLLQFNEVYNGQNVGGYPAGACDWAGYDFDIGMSGGLGQYMYSHHNGGPGFLMLMGDGAAEAQVIPLRA